MYIYRREELGQTIATSVNYLKNLNTLITAALNTYCLEDPSFPKSFDGSPSVSELNGIKLLHQKLKLLYARKLKLHPVELFQRKTVEATTAPDYSKIHGVMDIINESLPNYFDQMEDYFGGENTIKLLADKTSTPFHKHGSTFGSYQT